MPFKSQAQERFMWAKHPKLAKEFEEDTPDNAKLPQHVKKMADGGLVPDEQEKLYKYLSGQGGLDMRDIQATNDMGIVPRAPVTSPTPATPISPVAKETPRDEKIMDSNPGHAPEDLANYVRGQQAQIDKYGPEQEKAVIDNILKSQNSIGTRIGRGANTFADAVMRGVAGAPSDFLQNFNQQRNEENAMLANEIPTLQNLNMQNMAAKERLEGMTSTSPLGASQVAPLAAFFKKVGVPEKDIPAILANPSAARSVVEPFAALMTNEQKLQMESLLKSLELNQRSSEFEASNKLDEEKRKQEALESVAKMPWWSHITNRPALKAMKEQAGLEKRMIKIKDSDGILHSIPEENLDKAKERDPGLQVQ